MENDPDLYFAIICYYKYFSILYSGQVDRRDFRDPGYCILESKFVKKGYDIGNLMKNDTSGHKSCSFFMANSNS